MPEVIDATQELESTTLGIFRTAAVSKGGKRFSFGALVVVGDRRGRVGIGYAKAPGVPAAIEKAQKDARKHIRGVQILEGTLPHPVNSSFGASSVRLIPAAPGTGVIAGATVRAVLELAGVKDCLSKAYGARNAKNLSKATINGLLSMRNKEEIAKLRGVELAPTDVEAKLEAGRRWVPQVKGDTAKAKGPVNLVGKGRERGGGGGRGGRGGRGGGGGGRGGHGGHGGHGGGHAGHTAQAAPDQTPSAPAAGGDATPKA